MAQDINAKIMERLSVKDFGALGDGATDDTAAIQAAIDAIGGAGGGELFIPSGTYIISQLAITDADVTLTGAGWTTILSTNTTPDPAPAADVNPIIWVKANNCTLRNFKVCYPVVPTVIAPNMPIEKNATIAFGWQEITGPQTLVEYCTVENVWVDGSKCHGIAIGRSRNAKIDRCRVSNIMGSGIWGHYASRAQITNNVVHDTVDAAIDLTSSGVETPVHAYGPDSYAYDAIITANIVYNCDVGVGMHGVHRGIISSNSITLTYGPGIYVGYGDGSLPYSDSSEIVIADNIMSAIFAYYGAGTPYADHIVATLGGAYGAIDVTCSGSVTIKGNDVTDTSGLTTGYSGLQATAERLIISNNNYKQTWGRFASISPDFIGGQPANDGIEVLSDDAGDTTQTVTVHGVTGGVAASEAIALNALDGTTPVASVKVDWDWIESFDLDDECDGTITVREASASATIATLVTGRLHRDVPQVKTLSMTGNNVEVAEDLGTTMISLLGVRSGVIAGNCFDCGQQTVTPAYFVGEWFATNVRISDNAIISYDTLENDIEVGSSSVTLANNIP